MISQSALARSWGVSQPAVAKMVKRGMPLTSEEDARAWKVLDGQRKSRTKPTNGKPKPPAPAATVEDAPLPERPPGRMLASGPVPTTSGKGAEHALKRLADEEISTFDRLQAAMDALTDPSAVESLIDRAALAKLAREDWLKTLDSLRKYELAVDESKRDSGQLIPRAESEIACELAAMWLRLAVRTFIGSYVDRIVKAGGDHAAIVRLIENGMEAGVNTSLIRCTDCRVPLQPWAIVAVRRGYGLGATAELPPAPAEEGDEG